MKDSKRELRLEDCSIWLAEIAQREPKGQTAATRAVHRYLEFSSYGYPRGSVGGGRGGGHGDPVATLALAKVTDQETQDRQALDDAINTAYNALSLAASLVRKAINVYAAPENVPADSDENDWCASCSRHRNDQGEIYWFPSAASNGSVRRTPEGTMGGRAKSPLCSACYGFSLEYKSWPPIRLIELKRQEKPWTSKSVSEAMART